MRVAIIPARGGSRRIPRKNIRPFWGKPIIAYSIETALLSGLFDRVLVSTDDDEIAGVARAYGATVAMRDSAYAENEVGTQAVVQHVLQGVTCLYACCIYATCPMLTVEDLHDGWRALKKRVARYAFSVGYPPLRDAGMFYWGTAGSFVSGYPLISPDSVMVLIPESRVCDINTEEDWTMATQMYAAQQRAAA